MSFWSHLFKGDRSQSESPPIDREKIPRQANEGHGVLRIPPEDDSCGLIFLFDYDSMEGEYGKKIFQDFWAVLKVKIGKCVLADGDLPVRGGDDITSIAAIVPSYTEGPLSLLACNKLEEIHAYGVALYQEDFYTQDLHSEFLHSFRQAYLGCILLKQTIYSRSQFEEMVDSWGLVQSMEFHDGHIVRNGHGISQ